MSVPISKLDHFKLETVFGDGYVVNATFDWHLSTKRKRSTTWRQDKILGTGGFGSIWLQREPGGQLRAVKEIRRHSAVTFGFTQELLALIMLADHKHLFVEFYGWYENEVSIFLAMEYIKYGDLSIYNTGDATANAKEITTQVLEGLVVLHAEGICHRDLKPQNILVASHDPLWVKVADFGTSKRSTNTALRTMCGTQGYMAPELLRLLPQRFQARNTEEFTYALDIWSLGCMVHELLTSQTPFLEVDSGFSEFESGFPTLLAAPEVDMGRLYEYCHGKTAFPIEILQSLQVAEEGIEFVKSLLVAIPNKRVTAATALQDPWLANTGYTSDWYGTLESQCTDLELGLSLGRMDDRTLLRQFRTRDIARYISAPRTDNLTLLLEQALEKGHDALATMLLNSPTRRLADPTGEHFQALITRVVGDGIVDWMKVLLSDEQHPNLTFSDGRSMLQFAVQQGHLDMVTLLLDRNADVNAGPIDVNGRTALQTAVEHGRIDLVKLLLDNNANINTSVNGRTVLQIAATGGQTDIAEVLLARMGSFSSGMGTRPALLAAIDAGSTEMVKLLLNHKADVNTRENNQTPLKIAVLRGHVDIVNLLLDNNAQVNTEYDGLTVFDMAVECGYTGIVKLLLQNHPTREIARTAFLAAVCGSHLDIVKQFLVHEADVDSTQDGRSVLQMAVENGDISMAKLLLESNADISATVNGRSVLQVAIQVGHIDLVKLLLNYNAHNSPEKGKLELITAVRCAKVDIVQLLLDNNADVNAKEDGQTALQIAVENRDTDILQLLLGNDTHVHTSENIRASFLAAVSSGDIDIVQLMLASKANVNAEVNFLAAFQIAVEYGHIEVVKFLLNHSPVVYTELSNEDRKSILRIAIEKEQIEVLKFLIGNTSDGNRGSVTRESLLLAVGGVHFPVMEFLLEHNAALITTETIRTSLESAIMRGYLEIVELLLEHTMDINEQGLGGDDRTLLQVAAESGHMGMVELLLARNANVNIRSSTTGWTTLQFAAWSGDTSIVKLLLDNNADINAAPSDTGYTALQGAAHNGHIDLVKLLLARNADVNAKASKTGWTALQGAAKHGHIHLVKLFLKNGATINGTSSTGYTALQCAIKGGHTAIAKLFSDEVARKENQVNLKMHLKTLAVVRLLSDMVLLIDTNLSHTKNWTRSPTIIQLIRILFSQGMHCTTSIVWCTMKTKFSLNLHDFVRLAQFGFPEDGAATEEIPEDANKSWEQLFLAAGAASAATLWLTQGEESKPELFGHGVFAPVIVLSFRYLLHLAGLEKHNNTPSVISMMIWVRLLIVLNRLQAPNSGPWRSALIRPIVEMILPMVFFDGRTKCDMVRHRTLENLIQPVCRIIQLLGSINMHRIARSDRRAFADAAVRSGSLVWLQSSYL